MSQFRFHNYQRPLSSFDENLRIMGLAHGSVYSGFDEMSVIAGNTLAWAHTTSALKHTQQNGAAALPRSVVVTQQGTIVMEDNSIQLNVDFNVGNAFIRKDLLILTHSYLDSVGGSNAVYSIIKGPLGSTAEPGLTNPLVQVKIGTIIVQPNAANHTLTTWDRSETKTLGGLGVFSKFSESEVMSKTGEFFKNANNYDKSGFYYLYNSPLNVPALPGQTDWFLIVSTRGSKVNQMIQAAGNGKVYSRAWNGTSWTSWISLNNPDVETNINALSSAIGDRLYLENNYILDSESITASINKLDIALKDVSDLLTIAQTDINNIEAQLPDMLSDIANLQSYVGTLYFDYDRVTIDGESLTSSVNRLDSTYREINGTHDLNNAAFKVGLFLVTALPTNGPSGFFKDPAYPCYLIANYNKVAGTIFQTIIVGFGAVRPTMYSREFNGTVWTGWGIRSSPIECYNKSIELKFFESAWNMDTTSDISIAHGVNATRILFAKASILGNGASATVNLETNDIPPASGGQQGRVDWSNTNIILRRAAGGLFDQASYNASTAYVVVAVWVP